MTSHFGFSDTADSPPSTGGGYVLPPEIPQSADLSQREIALRDLFVAEYLVDYDMMKAAMRCGFAQQMAVEYGQKLFYDSYVQVKLSRIGIGKNDGSEETVAYDKKRIQEALMREAHNYGPGSSHAARVSALKALAEIHSLVERKVAGQKSANAPQGGVMTVPAIADLTEWEQAASASQDALIQHAGTGE